MDANLFQIVMAIASALGGWWMKTMWEALKSLKEADDRVTQQLSDLRVMVAGQYVSQESFTRLSSAIFAKLDRIEDKLDNKVDKT